MPPTMLPFDWDFKIVSDAIKQKTRHFSGRLRVLLNVAVLLWTCFLAEREGFEPSIDFLSPYSLSRGAPSTTRPSLRYLSTAQLLVFDVSNLGYKWSQALWLRQRRILRRLRRDHSPFVACPNCTAMVNLWVNSLFPIQTLCAAPAPPVRCIYRRSPPKS